MGPTRGAEFAMLLLQGFEALTAEVVEELDRQGHPSVTATHHFAMEAVDAGAEDASALARSLGVTRQAAAKTIRSLEQLGYVERGADEADARRRPLHVTERGHEMTRLGAAAYDELRTALQDRVGTDRLLAVEEVLRQIPGLRLPSSGSPG